MGIQPTRPLAAHRNGSPAHLASVNEKINRPGAINPIVQRPHRSRAELADIRTTDPEHDNAIRDPFNPKIAVNTFVTNFLCRDHKSRRNSSYPPML